MDTLLFRRRKQASQQETLVSAGYEQPLRSELLSIDLLKEHARNLAQSQKSGHHKSANLLLPRLAANEKILCDYNEQTLEAEKSRRVTPAAEWLLDNFHLIEEQIRTARRHLPRRFNRELPHLEEGPLAGFPRVYEIALELISHIDGRIDALHLTSFVAAYQENSQLKLGELWAIPIMLRLALIENLRRIVVMLCTDRRDRDLADAWADKLLAMAETNPSKLIVVLGEMATDYPSLSRSFVAEFWRRIQEKLPPVKLAVSWIEQRLAEDGLTIDQLVQSESQNQAATQVSVGNCIGSLRFLDSMDWQEFVESQSAVEQTLRTDPAGVYAEMDFATRDMYRHTIERIARNSHHSELEIASLASGLAKENATHPDRRHGHVGFYLLSKGVVLLEQTAGMKLPLREILPRFARRNPLMFYLGSVVAISGIVSISLSIWAVAAGLPTWAVAVMTLLTALAASQLAVSLVNWFVTIFVQPTLLPRLDFSNGITSAHSTLVVVPTMLSTRRGVENLLEALEIRYLANRDANVYFALLTDFLDAPQEHMQGDEELVRLVTGGIQALNEKYKHDRVSIFYLFHRPRKWNEHEGVWMGYERKRGKLSDLNRCLRGGSPECFSQIAGDLSLLPHIKYVITLDTDTQLPRDAARQLAATMAHPLNAPIYDKKRKLIAEGYTILQPRVAVSLPSAGRSRFVKLFSGDPGIDPYTRAVSDVYQDVFQEGSFIGKGIYDVDAFERAVSGRFPENRILSHDLLEGSYARAALVSDVQLYEDYPASFSVDTRRRHRWMRGDWQIATWLLPRLPGPDVRRVSNPLTGLSRWKIFDNLRRSLVPFAIVLLLSSGWIVFPTHAALWSLLVVTMISFPFALAAFTELLRKPKELPFSIHIRGVGRTAAKQMGQALLTLAFLPYDACVSLDAVMRTLGRLIFTRRKLLEWQTASETEQHDDGSLKNFLASMWCAPALALAFGLMLFVFSGHVGLMASPLLLLWFVSPVAAWWISLPLKEKRHDLSQEQMCRLRKLARKTWSFFEAFVIAEDHWLPPDNFQEYPKPLLATRTSPTNIGMALVSTLAAYDFGYLSLYGLVERLTHTVETMEKMERYHGHFYNWYDTRTLKPMPPLYVSTVDSGNLAGLLLTLHSGLLELADQKWSATRIVAGLRDTLLVLRELSRSTETTIQLEAMEQRLTEILKSPADAATTLNEMIDATAKLSAKGARGNDDFESWRRAFDLNCQAHRDEIEKYFPWVRLSEQLKSKLAAPENQKLKKLWDEINTPQSLRESAKAMNSRLAMIDEQLNPPSDETDGAEMKKLLLELRGLVETVGKNAQARISELEELASRCDELARMDFTLLYDTSRELFSIGYNISQHKLDASCYDLLASEARLGSFVTIALGQAPQNHWFRLGRLLTTTSGKPTLISWSGSMFEYLMPMMIMPSYENTLLDLSSRSAVARQIEYGKHMGVPWGMSESGYNLRDADANYQYRAFGVPGLGFKRGLADDIVTSPYATVMALMVSPQEAFHNLEELRREGGEGRYGFYEAMDYTPSRVQRGKTHEVVQSFMAHHQGMSLLSLAYVLLDRPMQRRFNSNPLFKSAELLLHERVPKEASVLYPHELEANRAGESSAENGATLRVFTDPNAGPPEVHLLSNGRYHVMITNAGGGYSRWNDIAMTRWREDVTRDCWGTFFYLRDVDSGKFWSTAHQPTLKSGEGYEAIFSQGRAEFRSRMNEISSHTEISVSPEDDVEVRRVTLTNHSNETRTIEVTSYAEIVLNAPAADMAHRAFSNLFVQTQILPGKSAVVCSRRPSSHKEELPSMCHLMLAHGTEVGTVSFETDRSQFLGRGRNVDSPIALNSSLDLSNSEGSVLDPIVAIRRTLRLQPNESAKVTLVSGIAATREGVLALVEKYQDQTIANRSFELAWTHGLIMLHHLNATEMDAQLYGRLASALLYSQPSHRANAAALLRNRRGQRNLWSFGISGDLPIVLVYSTHLDRLDLVRQIVQAHAYWRLKGLAADLVILNEDDSVYRQSLHDQIMGMISSGNAAQLIDKPGGIFTRRVDQLSQEDRMLLEAAARVVLNDENGLLPDQLQRRARAELTPPLLRARMRIPFEPSPELPERELIFFNGLGGFTRDGREYVTTLQPGKTTPAPWVNVLGNPDFGTVVSESGGAYTWSENCHEFRLTPWHNDAVTDVSGEAFYIRDEHTGRFWSPTPLPARGQTPYVIRHGFGYTVFEHVEDGISSELWIYVAVNCTVKFAVFKLRNLSARSRRLTLTGYWEWVLGEMRQKCAMHVATEMDSQSGALLARNSYNTDFDGRVAFAMSTEPMSCFTADRTEFLGRNGTLADPTALHRVRLVGKTGIGLDPCAALQVSVELAPREKREVAFVLGAGQNLESARELIKNFRNVDSCREALQAVWAYWNNTLGAVAVETPEPALNVLANGWLLYQTLSCRLWARTGFYQSGGAFGFRDQLQDSLALVHARPVLLREQLLRAAAHQFLEGDVLHWWHPPHERGVRTHFSDDYLWLPYATYRYVEAIGDTEVLDEKIPFLEGRPVRPEEEAYYDAPHVAAESGTLYEHCVRAIKYGFKFGEHGLPLMGCGDWNDGMNLIGKQGKGESVWLAFFLFDVLKHFSALAKKRGDKTFAQQCEAQAERLRENIEKNAWDGHWYRRAYFDNGEPLGSAQNPECQIDSLPQSWSVISGAGDAAHSRTALDAVAHRLVRREAKLIQLFDPPFDKSPLEPGYIKGYVPGVRENGGQYTHAAIWTVMAFALAGDTQRAWELFTLINPVLHAHTTDEIACYKAEPYVMAADIYSVPPHTGRGGWTWYTGSAGWMYRLIIETFLGLKLEADKLFFTPRIPAEWKSFKVDYRFRETLYHITLVNTSGQWRGDPKILLDGKELSEASLPLMDDRKDHQVEVRWVGNSG